MAETVPDYCPFCGARLRDDGLDPHLDEHDDCAERFAAWRGNDGTTVPDSGELNTGGKVVVALVSIIIIGFVLAYSLFITQQLLLGIVGAFVIAIAFVVAAKR